MTPAIPVASVPPTAAPAMDAPFSPAPVVKPKTIDDTNTLIGMQKDSTAAVTIVLRHALPGVGAVNASMSPRTKKPIRRKPTNDSEALLGTTTIMTSK